EAAEPRDLEIGADLAQKIRRQECVAADVVDLIEAIRIVTQDHVRGGAAGGGGFGPVTIAAGVVVFADDLACIVDAECKGGACEGPRNIESGEGAVFEVMQKAVMAGGVIVFADDLAAVVDAEGLGYVGGQGVVQCGESAAAQEEA